MDDSGMPAKPGEGSLFGGRKVTEESETFAVLTQAIREADKEHQTAGGGTRHWLRECFLPALEAHGLAVVEIERPQPRAEAETALTTAKDGTPHSPVLHVGAAATAENVAPKRPPSDPEPKPAADTTAAGSITGSAPAGGDKFGAGRGSDTEGAAARNSRPTFSDVTRLRALEVMGDTDTWTGSDWQHAAIMLASAVVAVAGDLEKVPPPWPGWPCRWNDPVAPCNCPGDEPCAADPRSPEEQEDA